jgi:hypothetical protein
MPKKNFDKDSWGMSKRVKLDEEVRHSDPFDQRVRVSRTKPDPKICHRTKKPHDYEELDRWQWSKLFKNDIEPDRDTIHITERCVDCGKKRHRHEKPLVEAKPNPSKRSFA